jgi:hypothetical protein
MKPWNPRASPRSYVSGNADRADVVYPKLLDAAPDAVIVEEESGRHRSRQHPDRATSFGYHREQLIR